MTEPRSQAPNPDAILADFRRAIDLLTKLMMAEGRARGENSPFKVLVIDATTRLEQARKLLWRFRTVELRLRSTPRMRGDRLFDLVGDLRLYGEAFYYFAWRAREALEALSRRDPAAGLNFTPRGVLHVRNEMIEHPDSKGLHVLSWVTDIPEGLVLNPFEGTDKGLYPNADEFIRKLLDKLGKCPYLKAPTNRGSVSD
jgi:hypothetical protein